MESLRRRTQQRHDHPQNEYTEHHQDILKFWTALPEEEKILLLPHILRNTKAWYEMDRKGDTKIADAWLAAVFKRAVLCYWE